MIARARALLIKNNQKIVAQEVSLYNRTEISVEERKIWDQNRDS